MDPATMMALGAGLGFFGSIMGAKASQDAGFSARDAYFQRANVLESRGLFDAADIYEEGAEVAGAIRARVGASGVELTGSPLIAMLDALESAESDAERAIEYSRQDAEYLRATGRAEAESGRQQAVAGVLGGLGGVAQGVFQYGLNTSSSGTGG